MYAIELSGQDTFSYLTGGTASSQLVYLFLYAGSWGIPLGDLELMRRLFSAIAVGKTGHPAASGADILSLKPITSRRISGWGGTPSSLKAIEKSREATGPHASDLSSQALVISIR